MQINTLKKNHCSSKSVDNCCRYKLESAITDSGSIKCVKQTSAGGIFTHNHHRRGFLPYTCTKESTLKCFPAAKATLHPDRQRAAASSDRRRETKRVPAVRLKPRCSSNARVISAHSASLRQRKRKGQVLDIASCHPNI